MALDSFSMVSAGKMELLSNKFFPAVTELLDAATQRHCLVIGTVPAARGGHSLAQARGSPRCWVQSAQQRWQAAGTALDGRPAEKLRRLG